MKPFLFSILMFLTSLSNYSQIESESKVIKQGHSVSEQIKTERDLELNKLQIDLLHNQEKIQELNDQLSLINDREYSKRIDLQDQIQKELDNRIKFLEETPRIKIKSNGQLAFTELLKIQNDIKPAKLYLSSNSFYKKLGDFDNLQNYSDFNAWKTEYDKWYTKAKGSNMSYDFLNSTIALISDASNKIPLYGSISQTVTSGITLILSTLKSKDKDLMSKTPQVLTLLNSIGQFEAEKAVIDNEWKTIDGELKELENDYKNLIEGQISFYKIDKDKYAIFLKASLDSESDIFKNYSRQQVLNTINKLEKENDKKWMGQVEKYMYQVQSIRIRFGDLTSRMLSNIEKYEELFKKFMDSEKYSDEFVKNATELNKDLARVKENFELLYNPSKYVADSVTMYIQQ